VSRNPSRPAALLLAWLSLQATPAGQGEVPAVRPRAGAITLPAGDVAELLELLEPPFDPVELDTSLWPDWSERSERGWGGELPWRRWVELVRKEGAAGQPDPRRRAELALLARLQGRDGDAWRHLVACREQPGLVARLLPLFVPGAPPASLSAQTPLPDGVLLRPALPPATEDSRTSLRTLVGRVLEHDDVCVAGARLSLRLRCEPDGLEMVLRHASGPAVRVRVAPPCPPGVDPGLVFADWERLPAGQHTAEFLLEPGSEEHTLWLTFHPREQRWPQPAPERLAWPAPERTLLLRSERGDEPHLRRFAEALAELFGTPGSLVAREAALPRLWLEPLVIELGPGGSADERKLASMISLAEGLALSRGGG
jgi:hypothetical protein